MKQILVQPEQVEAPKKLSQIIREFTFPQVRNLMTDEKGGYCVYAGLLKYFSNSDDFDGSCLMSYRKVMKLCDDHTLSDMIHMNNSGSTFSEIADWLESKQL